MDRKVKMSSNFKRGKLSLSLCVRVCECVWVGVRVCVCVCVCAYVRARVHICYLIQKYHGCKKGVAKNLKKGQDEKELKSKWVAKAGVC